MRSDPIFVGPGQSLSGKDITLFQWSEASGTVTNNSSQFGAILVGAAHVNSTTTFEAISGAIFGNTMPFLAAPTTSLLYVGWVDVNNNRQKDAFEASAVFGPAVPPISTVTLSIGGGTAPPGGTVALTPTIPHAGVVGDIPPQGMMKLALTGSGQQSRMTGVRLDITGGPTSNYGLSAWLDNNGNGTLDLTCGGGGLCDYSLGFANVPPGISSTTVNFAQPLALNAGSPTNVFVALEPFGLTGGHQPIPPLGLTIAASNYFLMGAGSMDADAVYPIVSNAAIGWSVMAQTRGDSFGGGGYDTGLHVSPGQSVVVSATGSWKFGGVPTDYRGLAGTENQPTLAVGQRVGAVLASVGEGWVAVGTGVTLTARFPFNVHLSANDDINTYFDNEGFATTNIQVTGSTTSHVSGIITYEGGAGGFLNVNLTQPCGGTCLTVIATTTVNLVGGTTLYAYGLHIPRAGSYKVSAFVSSQGSHRSGFVPSFEAPLGSTQTLNFPVSSGLGAITSTLTYSGIQSFGEFRVGVTTSPDLERGAQFFGGYNGPNAGPITIADLPIPNTYYIVGFRDGNFNQQPDGPEPFGALASVPSAQIAFAELSSVLSPIFVSSTARVAPIVLVDRGGISGRLFFDQAVSTGHVVITAAHGQPGSPEFANESRSFRFIQDVPANGSVDYFLGLLRPGADYTLFAFLDQNANDQFDAGERFGQTAGLLTVPSGGFANRDLTIGAPSAPPAVTGFFIGPFTTSQLELRWDATPGATEYQLLDVSSATVATLAVPATYYIEFTVPSATSAITGIRARNSIGAGPITRLPFGIINSAQAAVLSAPTFANVAVSSLTVNWTANGNGSLAKYQLERATVAAGPYQPVQYGSGLSKNEVGLAPNTQYFYQVKAQSPNGGFAAASAAGNVTTSASADSSIAGTLSYLGKQFGSVRVELYTSSNPFAGLSGAVTMPPSAQQPYYVPVANGTYFVRAFVDVDGDTVRDAGESQGTFASAVTVVGPETGKNFSIAVDTV
ncbi:MAG: hypothetical protein FD126_24, partial [Elusimicrobia bacterium]